MSEASLPSWELDEDFLVEVERAWWKLQGKSGVRRGTHERRLSYS